MHKLRQKVVNNKEIKYIAILGSTGSIGTQTLDVVSEYPDRLKPYLLTANRNVDLLAKQARKYRPAKVVIADSSRWKELKDALADMPIEVLSGSRAIADACADAPIDIVVTAMVGYSGLEPTMSAIRAGKTIALANKETLVVAGELITGMLAESGARLIPVDSEHSAIFQCLVGEEPESIEQLILTASGGPFRTFSAEQLLKVTVADALRHPNWNMGVKVTIDSASMMNKGFEMIEARWLFGIEPERISIMVHPQSIVHSMVEFRDGSIKAQLGLPDMRLPIRYALNYPQRLPSACDRLTVARMSQLTFEEADRTRFPLLAMAFEAIHRGGNMPCALNAANEVTVAAFVDGRIGFMDMPRIVEQSLSRCPLIEKPGYTDLVETNNEIKNIALSMI